MQSSILLNQGYKQYFKLSKTSLNKKKSHAYRSKMHTHTQNKSNQFYI